MCKWCYQLLNGTVMTASKDVAHATAPASGWVRRFAPFLPPGGKVLDLACGAGRHLRLLGSLGHSVTGVDRDLSAVSDLAPAPGVELIAADLEGGSPFPLAGRCFDGVVVTNYLYRPLLPQLVELLAPGGLLIYETFAVGNERFGKPSNAAFLLRPGELLEVVRGRLRVLAYEDLEVTEPKPAAVQRIAARRDEPPQN